VAAAPARTPLPSAAALPRDDLARLVLRLTLGLLLLVHGASKLAGGDAFIVGLVAKAGLPGALGHLVYLGEVAAPLLLVAGLWTRAAVLLVAGNMAVAVLLVHTGHFGMLNGSGGWQLELQAFYFATAVALALLGAGRFSVGGIRQRWN
jgi:putative oxidoreductase